MIRLTVATLAALYAVLLVFGEPERNPNVARAAVESDVQGLSLAAFTETSEDVEHLPAITSAISDGEAIRLALAAGEAARGERKAVPLRGLASLNKTVETPVIATREFWYVSGSRVNLRQGPGTGNAVVAQVTFGTEAEVLESQNGWHQIRTADGLVSGWIFSKFLSEQRPG